MNKTFQWKARLKNIQKKINFIVYLCKSFHAKLHVVYSSNINIYVDVWNVYLYAWSFRV